jgi:hypothetical protein
MSNQIQLDEILKRCLSPEQATRQEGEALIDQLATANFGVLLENCSYILSDENMPVKSRQLCATLIKNLINYIPKHAGQWDQLPANTKAVIKSYTLSCLASNIRDIRKAAGLTVAGKIIF